MVNVLSNEATDLSQNNSDINQMGMNLGNNAPVRDLDAERQTRTINDHTEKYEKEAEDFKKQQEKKEDIITQGQHEENITNWYDQLDKNYNNIKQWEDNIKSLEDRKGKPYNALNGTDREINKWAYDNKIKTSTSWNEKKELYKNYLNEQINNTKNNNSELRDNINNTKNNEEYDNRTDEQKEKTHYRVNAKKEKTVHTVEQLKI